MTSCRILISPSATEVNLDSTCRFVHSASGWSDVFTPFSALLVPFRGGTFVHVAARFFCQFLPYISQSHPHRRARAKPSRVRQQSLLGLVPALLHLRHHRARPSPFNKEERHRWCRDDILAALRP